MLPVKQFCGGPSGTKIIGEKNELKAHYIQKIQNQRKNKISYIKAFFQLKEKIGYN